MLCKPPSNPCYTHLKHNLIIYLSCNVIPKKVINKKTIKYPRLPAHNAGERGMNNTLYLTEGPPFSPALRAGEEGMDESNDSIILDSLRVV